MCSALVSLATNAWTAALVVSTVADSGAGSLRQAITDANADSDTDSISFAIAGLAVPQIVPATNLPAITNPVTIDGTTQSPAGWVELAGTTTFGLQITGNGVTVRGLVVNGFTTAAIKITGPGGNVIEGNRLGTDTTGTASASPVSSTGVIVTSSGDNRIGGWTAAARNLISGSGTGIFFSGSAALPNVVVGNWIGTDATGLAALPNTGHGIEAVASSGNTIGGTAAGAGNVVSGNGTDGISLSGSGYVIQGNLVGLGADGVTSVPNGRHGIRLLNTSADALIGGAGPNHVAHNLSAGVLIAANASTGNAIRGNSIHDNGALGIDTGGTGVNVNDVLDVDVGANLGQNYPVLDVAFAGGSSIDGTLDSAADTSFTVELFANASCDSSGYGEGAELVGTLVVATDVTGHVAFTAPFTRTIGAAELVTATATDPAGNTSEFSHCVPAVVPTTSTSSTTSSSTTSSTTTTATAPPSTSSTSTLATTTSSTSSTTGPTDTTTTSSTGAPDTSTTSTATPESSTTSTSVPTTSSTSTTAVATSSTSTTLDPATTTSTSAPDTTTTSSTDPGSTTTSTTGAPTTSSTSTSVPTTSSTSTTLDPVSSTSTSTPDTSTTTSSTTLSPTTSTTTLASSSTTTTVVRGSTTSTTLAGCTGDCPTAGCGSDVAFAPLRCRLADLSTTVADTRELAPMRSHLDRQLEKARLLFAKAEARCEVAKRGPARRSLRMVRRRLVGIGRSLRSKAARHAVPFGISEPITRTATTLGNDVRALEVGLACP